VIRDGWELVERHEAILRAEYAAAGRRSLR